MIQLPRPKPSDFASLKSLLQEVRDEAGDSTILDDLDGRIRYLETFDWPADGPEQMVEIESVLLALSPTLEEAAQWPTPEPLISTEPAPAMPVALLPQALRAWLIDEAELMSVPLEMIAVPAITALGAATGRSIALYPKQHDSWQIPLTFWSIVVAPPSSLKTPAIEAGTRPLERIASQALSDHETTTVARNILIGQLQDKLSDLQRTARTIPVPSGTEEEIGKLSAELEALQRPAKRYITSDATVEMLGELLRQNPQGLLIKRDELAGLFDSFDRKGREGDRALYLEAFNSKPNFTVDRIARGTLHIPALHISIIGGIQPGKMDAYVLDAISGKRDADGLLQRFQLAIYPERLPEYVHVDRPRDQAASERVDRLTVALTTLDTDAHPAIEHHDGRIPGLRFSADAQFEFNEWLTAHMQRIRSGKLDGYPAFQAHLGKYTDLLGKLALLFHLLDAAETGVLGPVSLDALKLAIRWVEYLEMHARKIYAAELENMPVSVRELATRLRAGDVQDGTSIRDLSRKNWKNLSTREAMATAIEYLTSKHWIRTEEVKGNGRPSTVIRINPALELQLDTLTF